MFCVSCEHRCERHPGAHDTFPGGFFLAGALANGVELLVSFYFAIHMWHLSFFCLFSPSSALDLLMALWLFRAISPLAQVLRIFSVWQLCSFCSLAQSSGLHNHRQEPADSENWIKTMKWLFGVWVFPESFFLRKNGVEEASAVLTEVSACRSSYRTLVFFSFSSC